ncbi:MAG: Asp23/Gls24 family envelope stress response protein, partial [Clostridiales bacterium]|nr:Asp23/Gls24 family envelope stress response protein [Clostridiales bacterium]
FDVHLDVKYGCKIPNAAWNIQENVKKKIEALTSEKLYQVNIHIMGVNFDGRDKVQ